MLASRVVGDDEWDDVGAGHTPGFEPASPPHVISGQCVMTHTPSPSHRTHVHIYTTQRERARARDLAYLVDLVRACAIVNIINTNGASHVSALTH